MADIKEYTPPAKLAEMDVDTILNDTLYDAIYKLINRIFTATDFLA